MNNLAAIGYMIKAAKEIGVLQSTIVGLALTMHEMMDLYTEDEAEVEVTKLMGG